MIKKLLLTSALVASFAAPAFADDAADVSGPQVTLGGSLDTQFGYVSQKKAFRYSDPSSTTSSKLSNHALVNNTKLWVKVDGEGDAGFRYGAEIKLNADTSKAKKEFFDISDSNRKAEQTMGYVEGSFGRVEMGNYHGASNTMKVDASTFARATGGIAGDARFYWNQSTSSGKADFANASSVANNAVIANFLTAADLPTNELGYVGTKGKNAGKVSYFTPRFAGFMVGLSYTPDVQSYGTIANSQAVTSSIASTSDNGPSFKNVFEGGLHYEYMFDQVGVKASVTGQAGTSKKINTTGSLSKKYHNLRAWNAGLNATYMGFTLGGSYGDWGKSMTAKASGVKGAKYWTVGAAYEYGPAGVSLTYLNTEKGVVAGKKKNKLEMLSLGLDYKLAPGLMPYAEVSCFKNKDKRTASTNNKGTVFLLGSKLQF